MQHFMAKLANVTAKHALKALWGHLYHLLGKFTLRDSSLK